MVYKLDGRKPNLISNKYKIKDLLEKLRKIKIDKAEANAPVYISFHIQSSTIINLDGKFRTIKISKKTKNIVLEGDLSLGISRLLNALQKIKTTKAVPVIYHSRSWVSSKILKLCKDFIDVFVFDISYFDSFCCEEALGSKYFPDILKENLRVISESRKHKLIIRLIPLPGHIECDAKNALQWIKENLKKYQLDIVPTYKPQYKEYTHSELGKALTISEFHELAKYAREIEIEF